MSRLDELHELGQSIWLDDISREMLHKEKIKDYIDHYSVTGLTSNPTIFAKALRDGSDYDDDVRMGAIQGESDEEIFFRLALADISEAADLFIPVFERTGGVDGWVSLELSPRLASDAPRSVAAAEAIYERAGKKNLFIKIPGTRAGLVAIEEAIFAGVPINITLLFSAKQYRAAAEAWLRGIERRIEAGRDPDVPSVASLFVSRWDGLIREVASPQIRNHLGIASAREAYYAYRDIERSVRWQAIRQRGVRTQRLLFASTSTKDPSLPDTFYVSALAAPDTINTMPEKTLLAFAAHGQIEGLIPKNTRDTDAVLEAARGRLDLDALAERLQTDGTRSFDDSWNELLDGIAVKAERDRPRLQKGA